MKEKIIIEEQGLRDGLQTLDIFIPTETKLRWITQLLSAGLERIQVTSFVNPKVMPLMADAELIFSAVSQIELSQSQTITALVLNEKGVDRAIAAGAKHLAISLSASNTHSLKNTRMSIDAAKIAIKNTIQKAKTNGIKVRSGVQCAFGCRFEGKIKETSVFDLLEFLKDCGADELALADSTGMANPIQMKNMSKIALQIADNQLLGLHLHNTENRGYANVYAAVEAGVRQFDTAFGGLGGCPFIKGATGNIATEDTVKMLTEMGFETNIDIEKVALISKEIEVILGHKLPGYLYSNVRL